MVQDTRAAKVEKKPDFDQCKLKFRETTVNIANNFSISIFDMWIWLKKRLDFVFEDGITISRQLNETKQKSYVMAGASNIWNNSAQGAIGIIREFIPNILNKLPEDKCKHCQAPFRVYTSDLKVVSNGWKQFWAIKAPEINKLKTTQQQEIIQLFRDTRTKFKYTLSSNCYGDTGEVLPQFHGDSFSPELIERVETTYNYAFAAYIETVINTLPDMVYHKSLCAGCHKPVQISYGSTL